MSARTLPGRAGCDNLRGRGGQDTPGACYPFPAPDVLDPRLATLRETLSRRPRRLAAEGMEAPRAAVALVLRPAGKEIELLLIKRAERAGDPWSGHMALPGGRRDPYDPDSRFTAVRETREEVGIDLDAVGVPLGALDEVHPVSGAPRIVISPFVFAAPAGVIATPNPEVEAAVWIPLSELAHPGAAMEHLLETVTGDPRRFPAIGARGYVVWGLTHRILQDFLESAGAARTEEAG
jgi:8-oxo-dGTP pyrophosphatase MutT (NUDIX family)